MTYQEQYEAERAVTAMLTDQIKQLRVELEAGVQISGSFFEALKPLNLKFIHVHDPGLHVSDLIQERNELKARLRLCQSLYASDSEAWVEEMGVLKNQNAELRRQLLATEQDRDRLSDAAFNRSGL